MKSPRPPSACIRLGPSASRCARDSTKDTVQARPRDPDSPCALRMRLQLRLGPLTWSGAAWSGAQPEVRLSVASQTQKSASPCKNSRSDVARSAPDSATRVFHIARSATSASFVTKFAAQSAASRRSHRPMMRSRIFASTSSRDGPGRGSPLADIFPHSIENVVDLIA
jgi:hypothetical protein